MEKPRMLEDSSTIPSRCRMGKSWEEKKGEVWGQAPLVQIPWQGMGPEGLLGVRTMVVRMYL